MEKPRIADILIPVIIGNESRVVAEVGVYNGMLTKSIISGVCGIEYHAIDPWKVYSGHGAGTLANVKSHEWESYYQDLVEFSGHHSNLHIIRKTSMQAVAGFPDDFFDLVFIDAIHDYENCKADILAWIDKVKPGGILCGHDYHKKFSGVIKAVDELLSNIELIGCTIWMHTKE